jgi:hypothetical protein
MSKCLTFVFALLFVVASSEHGWGRGFGGGRGGFGGGFGGARGGFGGGSFGGDRVGGFGGGGFDRSGFSGGEFNRGGFGGGEFDRGGLEGSGFSGLRGADAGGFRAGGFDGSRAGALGGYNAGRFGNFGTAAAPTRTGLNNFLGMPSDAGFQKSTSSRTVGNYTIDHGSVEGPRGGTASGTAIVGPNGGAVGRAGAVGPHGGVAGARGAVGPGGAGVVQGGAIGPGGRAAGGAVARGPAGGTAARGFAVGPHGAAAGFRYVSPAGRYAQGAAVRRGFYGYGFYTPRWYAAHPYAWTAAGLTAAAWTAATWNAMNGWFGYDATPVSYDYGDTVVYNNDNVYVNNQDVGTPQQYFQQAEGLASAGAKAQPADNTQWMPLGVFAMAPGEQTQSNAVVQLAVDKAGVIRGNYTDSISDQTLPIRGSVDKKSQRVAWTIGDNSDTVVEMGLYNLTQNEVPALVHFGKDRTQQWLMVRLDQKDKDKDKTPASE